MAPVLPFLPICFLAATMTTEESDTTTNNTIITDKSGNSGAGFGEAVGAGETFGVAAEVRRGEGEGERTGSRVGLAVVIGVG